MTDRQHVPSPTLHATAIFTMSAFIAIIVMSVVFRVEIVATGIGRVVPTARVQVVQPEFSGQIRAIHVRDGDAVIEGDILIELDSTDAVAELTTLNAEADRLSIEASRVRSFLALLNGSEPIEELLSFEVVPELREHPYFIEQRRLLRAEYENFLGATAQITSRIETNRRSIAVTQAAIAQLDTALQTRRERIDASRQLLEQGVLSRSAWLEMLESFQGLESEREIVLRELEQKESQEAALEREQEALISSLRNSLLQRMSDVDARQATLSAQLTSLERRVRAASLVAPVSGTVDQLSVHTVGGIAQTGQELLRVVPSEGHVEIEAMFSNADVGFLHVGLPTNIRLDAFPSERFGFVAGEIKDISADSVEMGDVGFVYVVRATPEEVFLRVGNVEHPLRSGMTLTMDVITGERRIISYFFAPIVEVVERSLGER